MPRINFLHIGLGPGQNFFINNPFNFNNNNHSPSLSMRNHMYQAAYMRMAIIYSRLFNEKGRKIIEYSCLALSLFSLLVLTYIHITFVRTPVNCLENIHEEWPRDGILRVEVLRNAKDYTLEKSYKKERKIRRLENKRVDLSFHRKTIDGIGKTDSSATTSNLTHSILDIKNVEENSSHINKKSKNQKKLIQVNKTSYPPHIFHELAKFEWTEEDYIIEYSLEYGFLRLSPSTRKNLNISVMLITLDPETNKCFGSRFSRFLLDHFLGYDDALLTSLKNLAMRENYKGYVRNVVTENDFIFVSTWTNERSFFTAAFMMMVFTISISILLRYSHHQIFLFIVELLHMLELHSTVNFPAAPLLTVILGLVGLEAIMSEFFNDPSIAFYIILLVWFADQFDSVWCRTLVSKRHWLRFFYLYHFAFYAYCYRFNGHFASLALMTSSLFIMHSMIFFFHRYELPDHLRRMQRLNRLNIDHQDSDDSGSASQSDSESASPHEPSPEDLPPRDSPQEPPNDAPSLAEPPEPFDYDENASAPRQDMGDAGPSNMSSGEAEPQTPPEPTCAARRRRGRRPLLPLEYDVEDFRTSSLVSHINLMSLKLL